MAASADGFDSDADMRATVLQVWGEYLQAEALKNDLKKQIQDAHSEFQSSFTERIGRINELLKQEHELKRKVAFFEQLSKFKCQAITEDALEGVGFKGALDENCVDAIKEKGDKVATRVVAKNVQPAEEEDELSCLKELTESIKSLKDSAGFELSLRYVEAKLVLMACQQEAASVSALLTDIENSARELECIALLKEKRYISTTEGGTVSGSSSSDI